MDDATFQRELGKYKVVRKPDYYRVRMTSQKPLIKTTKDKAPVKAAVVTTATAADVIQSQEQFWEIMAKLVAKQLGDNTSTEYKKFMKAFREEFAITADKVNLEDLDAIAASNN